jgi:hypothetical protein
VTDGITTLAAYEALAEAQGHTLPLPVIRD